MSIDSSKCMGLRALSGGALEPEARVEARMAEHDDEMTSATAQRL
jgi:hypothetical protein